MSARLDRWRAAVEWRVAALNSRILGAVQTCSGTVIRAVAGTAPAKGRRRLCVFATHDPDGVVDPYVAFHVRALGACGFDVVLVSTSPRIRDRDLGMLRGLCRLVVHRRNVGLDFASWRAGMELADLDGYDRVLLANDSVFGPCRDLAPVFSAFEASNAGLCGITDSVEVAPHLQSYFLYANLERMPREAWAEFWTRVSPLRDKSRLIRQYEIGISMAARAAGAKLFALVPQDRVHALARDLGTGFQYADRLAQEPLNVTLFMWDLVLGRCGSPYVKTELFRTDRFRSGALQAWRDLIPAESRAAIVPLIEAYVERFTRRRPPACTVAPGRG